MIQYLVKATLLDHPAGVHNADFIRHAGDDGQIVSNPDQRRSRFSA
jgi:hypothetical protein